MKVILLAPTPPPAGGISGWTVRMQKASLKNGWVVEVVDEKLIKNRDAFGDNNRKKLITEAKRSLIIWKKLISALKDQDAKIVHSCIPASTTGMIREYGCAVITKLYGRKFIIHYRCTLPNMINSKTGLFVFKQLTGRSNLAMVLNKDSRDFVEQYSRTNAVVIPNFIEKSGIIDTDKYIKERSERILYVGGVVKAKGCDDILKIAEKFPEIQFRLVGNPDGEIMGMARPSNVILTGEKNKAEVEKEFMEADVFLFATHYSGEGFSNALAEAMAKGLPCIVTDWAANKDMIENKGGIVVPVKDTKAMIAAVEKLKDDRELRVMQSKWNIEKVKTAYADQIVTELYVDEYEKLVEGRERHEN